MAQTVKAKPLLERLQVAAVRANPWLKIGDPRCAIYDRRVTKPQPGNPFARNRNSTFDAARELPCPPLPSGLQSADWKPRRIGALLCDDEQPVWLGSRDGLICVG